MYLFADGDWSPGVHVTHSSITYFSECHRNMTMTIMQCLNDEPHSQVPNSEVQ